MIFEKYKQWSLLDPKPIVFYNEDIDEWFVYWNGVFMIYDAALVLAGRFLLRSPPSKETVDNINKKFSLMLSSGIFNDIKDESWYSIAKDGVMTYYNKKMSVHITSTLKEFDSFQVLKWFTKRYE